MKKTSIRLLAMLLCVLSLTALLPTVAFAAEPADEVGAVANRLVTGVNSSSAQVPNVQANVTKKVTYRVGQKVWFSFIIYGYTGVHYQWQIKKGSNPWKNIKGATKTKYTIKKVTMKMNGNRYRCRATKAGYYPAYGWTWVLKVKK